MKNTKAEQSLHLLGLNGIREIAALAVLFSHIGLELETFGLAPISLDSQGKAKGLLLASYGVTMFFALSGFLITYLLLIEREKFKTIDISKFYYRRILRIWPLYYAFVIVCIISYVIFDLDFDVKNLSFYVFLLANFALVLNKMLPFMGHLWSIGVEEQFYLFWPWILKIRKLNLLRFSILFVLVFYSCKVLLLILSRNNDFFDVFLNLLNVTRFHVMIIGAIGAILYYERNYLFNIITSKSVQVLCWLYIICCGMGYVQVSSTLLDHELMAIVTVFIIYAQISRVNYLVDLDNKILNFIGKLSFGLYVIHPLLIFLFQALFEKFDESTILNYIIVYGSITASTILLSYISYELYEKKFIRLKDRFAKVKSAA